MKNTRKIVYTAMFAVLMVVCSWISIPTAIPFTMQTFAVFLTFNYLGGKSGIVSVVVYLLLGLIGLPVYANGTSGAGMLFGSTGGYMIGWIFSGLTMWLLEYALGNRPWVQIVSMIAGLIVCYALGTAWYMIVYAGNTGSIGLWTAVSWCVLPFVVPDILKLCLALLIGRRLKQISKPL